MAKKPNITTITSGYYSRQALNNNFEALREAFDNTVSRDGSTPNSMSGSLDMNGYSILNTGQIDVDSLTINGGPVGDLQSLVTYRSAWTTATDYNSYDIVTNNGNSYLCLVAHTSDVFSTDLSASRWGLLAEKGASGAGSGDLVSTNNLSDVADAATALANLGGQPLDATLTALAGTLTGVNKIPYSTSTDIAAELDFKDEDDMASDSATAVPSQQSVKAYVDAEIAGVSSGIGYGQTWQNVAASRANNTEYQNTTGKPIMVFVTGGQVSGTTSIYASVGTSSANLTIAANSARYGFPSVSFIVPDQHYYKVSAGAGIQYWSELR